MEPRASLPRQFEHCCMQRCLSLLWAWDKRRLVQVTIFSPALTPVRLCIHPCRFSPQQRSAALTGASSEEALRVGVSVRMFESKPPLRAGASSRYSVVTVCPTMRKDDTLLTPAKTSPARGHGHGDLTVAPFSVGCVQMQLLQ